MSSWTGLSAGRLMLDEINEFGCFRPEVQRYICRSLDVAFCPAAVAAKWSRDQREAESIEAQIDIYQDLAELRRFLPRENRHPPTEHFLVPLIALTAFDVTCGPIPSFSAYRFLYERLLGADSRPYLPAAFCAAAGLPHLPRQFQRSLIDSVASALGASWSPREPTFFPKWLREEPLRVNLCSGLEG